MLELSNPSTDLIKLNESYVDAENAEERKLIARKIRDILVPELEEHVEVIIEGQGRTSARRSPEDLELDMEIEQNIVTEMFANFLLNPALGVSDIPEGCMGLYSDSRELIEIVLEAAAENEDDSEEPEELVFE